MKKVLLVTGLMTCMMFLKAQSPKETGLQAITPSLVKAQLEFLSSDWMEGRATGTRGEYLAGDYIASMFKSWGIQPYGDREPYAAGRGRRGPVQGYGPGRMSEQPLTYFQNINMIEYSTGEAQELAVITRTASGESAVHFGYRTDFMVRTGTVGQSACTQLVFAGYGYTNEKLGYDDYKKTDVKGKIVVILSGFPGHRDVNSEAYKKFRPEGRMAEFAIERDKANQASKMGAIGLIQIRPGEDPAGEWVTNRIYPVKGRFYEGNAPIQPGGDKRLALREDTLRNQLAVFTVTRRVINQIFDGTGIDFAAFEKNVQEKMVPSSTVLPGKMMSYRTTVKTAVVRTRNVLGYIEGEKKNEVVIAGAHYDHMGMVDGWIWNGADDNASGTVGVMTIARAFAASGKKPEKTIVFAAWTGEEKGLLGSSWFVRNIPDSVRVKAYLNYDMIARDELSDSMRNQADMTYTEDFPGLKEMTVKNVAENKINLQISYRASKVPRGGSDHAPFAEVGIPIFYFMAAMHDDYHQPSDEVSKVNWDKMTNIIRTGYLGMWDLANGEGYLKP